MEQLHDVVSTLSLSSDFDSAAAAASGSPTAPCSPHPGDDEEPMPDEDAGHVGSVYLGALLEYMPAVYHAVEEQFRSWLTDSLSVCNTGKPMLIHYMLRLEHIHYTLASARVHYMLRLEHIHYTLRLEHIHCLRIHNMS